MKIHFTFETVDVPSSFKEAMGQLRTEIGNISGVELYPEPAYFPASFEQPVLNPVGLALREAVNADLMLASLDYLSPISMVAINQRCHIGKPLRCFASAGTLSEPLYVDKRDLAMLERVFDFYRRWETRDRIDVLTMLYTDRRQIIAEVERLVSSDQKRAA